MFVIVFLNSIAEDGRFFIVKLSSLVFLLNLLVFCSEFWEGFRFVALDGFRELVLWLILELAD